MYLIDPETVIRMNRNSLLGDEVHGLTTGGRSILESTLGRPLATFDGMARYATITERAGALMHGMATTHPFIDGNKRTNIMATGFYLLSQDRTLDARRQEIAEFVTMLAVTRPSVDYVIAWLDARTLLRRK